MTDTQPAASPEGSPPEQTSLLAGMVSLGRIGAAMAITLVGAGTGLYFVLRHQVKFLRDQEALGVVLWAGVWLWLCYELLKLGVKHREVVVRLGTVGPLAVVTATMPAICGFLLLIYVGPIAVWLKSHEMAGFALYVAAFVTLSGLALLPTYAQAILGGWAFGLAWGLSGAMVGFVGGSVIGYGIARLASGDRVTGLVAENPRWNAVRRALLESGFWKTVGIVTLVRIPPNSPFAMTNLALASLGVRLLPFILGTAVGMLPRTAVVVNFAVHLTTLVDPETGKFQRPGWQFWAGIVSSLVVLAILGQIAKSVLKRVTDEGAERPGTTDV